jgi:hypothetical protein
MTTIQGIVKDGRIDPDTPLPEGARVEIHMVPITMADLDPELRENWKRGSSLGRKLGKRLNGC